MPPPSSENDLKRLARRRLIGAVALTLLAVIVLPLLLEDEPPPTSSLSVHMTTAPEPAPNQSVQPAHTGTPALSVPPVSHEPEPPAPEPVKPVSKPAPIHEAAKPAPVEAAKLEPAKPVPKPRQPAAEPVPAKHAAASEMFVVQLAALSDGAKASELKARAVLAGLPAYTDTVGKLTRVRVGPYPTREAAVAAAVKLAENGMTGQVLTK